MAAGFKEAKASGYGEEEILRTIGKMHVEPVLTAHPTEAKRATVLEHRELYLLLVQRENAMWTPIEHLDRKIKTNVEGFGE